MTEIAFQYKSKIKIKTAATCITSFPVDLVHNEIQNKFPYWNLTYSASDDGKTTQ